MEPHTLGTLSVALSLLADLDLRLTVMASSLYRLLATHLGVHLRTGQSVPLPRRLIHAPATNSIRCERIQAMLALVAHYPYSSTLATLTAVHPTLGSATVLATSASSAPTVVACSICLGKSGARSWLGRDSNSD